MNSFTAVMLVVTIITGEGKPDVRHQERMPDMETCLHELGEFLNHKFPDTVDAKGLSAGCSGKLAEENPS
jgi:hypothetical protein